MICFMTIMQLIKPVSSAGTGQTKYGYMKKLISFFGASVFAGMLNSQDLPLEKDLGMVQRYVQLRNSGAWSSSSESGCALTHAIKHLIQ